MVALVGFFETFRASFGAMFSYLTAGASEFAGVLFGWLLVWVLRFWGYIMGQDEYRLVELRLVADG